MGEKASLYVILYFFFENGVVVVLKCGVSGM